METAVLFTMFWVDIVGLGQPPTLLPQPFAVTRLNRTLKGHLLDYTANHGCDRRIWSPSLNQKRDMYVYLPPCFDRRKRYPLIICLHGAAQDEQFFRQTVVLPIDRAIAAGQLPPVILAAPDGSMYGRPALLKPATFFANSNAGRFEDFVMHDVWGFLMHNFPILPEREAHGLMGASMGGSAAFALAIKHRNRIKFAAGVHPLLNLRYVDCHGKYDSPFDPSCWGVRREFKGSEALGRRRMFVLRYGRLFRPMYGNDEVAIKEISRINPLELMDTTNLQGNELSLFVAYGGKDEFNVAAQVESFLYRARQRRVPVSVCYCPNGKHNMATSRQMAPYLMQWTAQQIPALRWCK